MFWFEKENPDVTFIDCRVETHELCDGRELIVNPDVVASFENLPFEDESFYHVVFDPPHLLYAGRTSWMAKKYGSLDRGWEQLIRKGFKECFRVLKPNGTLVFKWNETDIPISKVLKLTDVSPLYGHKSGKQQKTHWVCFIKPVEGYT
ncbi:MAG: SAM-dependent methyltransferase [Verrucomicrobiota bacterium]